MANFLRFAAGFALITASSLVTVRFIDRPGLVVLVGASGAIGYIVAHLLNYGQWLRQERRIGGDIGRILEGMRISGRAPVALAGDQADADRYRRLDQSLEQYTRFLMSDEGR